MSQENDDLVRQLQPAPGLDLTEMFQRGDEEAGSLAAASVVRGQKRHDSLVAMSSCKLSAKMLSAFQGSRKS